jgi:hypothetical protein
MSIGADVVAAVVRVAAPDQRQAGRVDALLEFEGPHGSTFAAVAPPS